MKKSKTLYLLFGAIFLLANELCAQVGYYDAPYTRYEANVGALTNATVSTKSYNQGALQSEASEQVCVDMSANGAAVSWNVTAAGDGLVVRYSVPDGQSGVLQVWANGTNVGTLNLSSYWSWEYLSTNGNPNNVGVVNNNPKMRFDEVRMKLPSSIPIGGTLRLVRQSGNITLDFAELEPVPAAIAAPAGSVTFSGGSLQTFITNNGGRVIYVPAGVYNIGSDLFFGNANTTLMGAGMWYTQLNFTSGTGNDGGLWAQAANINFSDLYLTTDRNSRSNSYKALNGAYTTGTRVTRVWAEHFECGAWIAQYGTGPANTDGLTMSYCRFRNNYADGTNLCKGTVNTIVEHCSYRNNGDDDMAIWSANNQECRNNTFRYNTSENCWRASGVAIYGGFSNKAHNILIQDNLEVGIKVNNAFGGAGFNGGGMHELYNIIIKRCGTYNDLFNSPVGAIDLGVYNWGAGTRVQNVKFSCIDIIDSKNDAIYFHKVSGDGFYNLVFENIKIDGTGREYPNNGGAVGGRGYGILFKGYPTGNGTYCNITYANRSGSAGSDVNTGEIGSFSWNAVGGCPTGCSLGSSTLMTSATTFGVCDNPITLTANTTAPSGNTTSYVEFFVDGVSIGTDNSAGYSMAWNNPTAGTHQVVATAHYSPSGSTASSPIQYVNVLQGIYPTSTPPTIDGTIDASWAAYPATAVTQGFNSTPDLAATFKTRYDANYLYILVDVTDDVVQADGGNNWDNDGIEIFLDLGNDKTGVYGANDFQFAFVTGNTTPFEYKHTTTAGIVNFAQGAKAGGYIMEIRLSWSGMGVSVPSAGSYVGFDVGVNDDDNNGVRDNQLSWNDPTFTEYNNTALFGTLQIPSCSSPLPVALISFTGEKRNATTVLDWSTASEMNNHKFIIERSADYETWEVIGDKEGAGNSHTINTYSFTDETPLSGRAYYRLRQVDFDGTVAYSDVVVLHADERKTLTIAPNPFENEFNIQSNAQGKMEVKIYDVMGRLLYEINAQSYEGSLDLQPTLPSGSYIITIQTETFIEQRKIVKR
jgi:hypothetical protein